MNIANRRKIMPHLLIVLIIFAVCFFTMKPFLGKYLGLELEKTEVVQTKSSEKVSKLGSLMEELFSSKQFEDLVAIKEKLPIVRNAATKKDSFKEIQEDSEIGVVGRKNPFSSIK